MSAYSSAHADAFAALGDPTRRAVLERLFPVSRPAVSQHLKVLEEARLVTHERDGSRRVYKVDPAGVERMRAYFDEFWSDALAAYREAAGRKGAT